VQRVAYRIDQDGLWRDHWRVLDRTQATEPVRLRLLSGVRSVTFRFMNQSRQWVDRWPQPEGVTPAGQERTRPAAVEVTLELEDWGVITRIVEVSG
jgi:type II secretion system protein J